MVSECADVFVVVCSWNFLLALFRMPCTPEVGFFLEDGGENYSSDHWNWYSVFTFLIYGVPSDVLFLDSPKFLNHFAVSFQIMLEHTPGHLLLDRSPNIGPLISRWELDKFYNCWNKSFRTAKILTLLYQQSSNLLISQRDMSGPRIGALSTNRWSGGNAQSKRLRTLKAILFFFSFLLWFTSSYPPFVLHSVLLHRPI